MGKEKNIKGFIKRTCIKCWPLCFLLLFGLVFFGYFLRGGKVLLPADVLVGAYYPWRENKWGYEVAVPYKNPLLTDSYSQLYIWKSLIGESYKAGEWPLWNKYSYSGYPLAANIQSAAFYPFNALFLIMPFNEAWNWYLLLGSVLSSVSMYFFLRVLRASKGASVVGALAYAYSGYAITWMEFATTTNSMIWIPLLLFIVEKFFRDKDYRVWWFLGPVMFLLISSGSFQMSLYGVGIFGVYLLFKMFKEKKLLDFRIWIRVILSSLLGVGISGIVLIPGIEMLSLSIRNLENSMQAINYGLVPLSQLVTTFIPDLFGNPATGNYWGFLNYHETLIYGGSLMFLGVMWFLLNFSKIDREGKFFGLILLVSLFFYVDNPLAQWIYSLDIPGIKTMTAGRNAFFWCLGGSVLISRMIDGINMNSFWAKTRMFIYWWLFFGVLGVMVFLLWKIFGIWGGEALDKERSQLMVAMRNMVIPLSLSLILGVVVVLFSKWKWWWLMLVVVVALDSGRFVKKYLPISESKYVFPDTEVTDFLKNDKGVFRVEKEKGALLSPNTWTMYGLMSPSGYDPMALAEYTKFFNMEIHGSDARYSRYAEIETYDSMKLGKFNVKYLLAIKKDEEDRIPGDKINHKISQYNWDKVFESEVVAVLENKDYIERARIVNDKEEVAGKVSVFEYGYNTIKMNYESENGGDLVLLDTWYPGWKAWVNGKEREISVYNKVFRKVAIDDGEGVVEMKYDPESFRVGKLLSISSFVLWFVLIPMMYLRKFKA